jgi:GWxTD domain-containing protein
MQVLLTERISLLLLIFISSIAIRGYASQVRSAPTNQACLVYKDWLEEDVNWIITPKERLVFSKLHNDDEREQFVEYFWSQRDPTPETIRNEFKDQHYRRLAYARTHLSDGQNWRTAKARLYVMYGAPDEIDMTTLRPTFSEQKSIGDSCSFIPNAAVEEWTYQHLPKVDHPTVIWFSKCADQQADAFADRVDADFLSKPPVPYYKPICDGMVDLNQPPPNGVWAYVCGEKPPQARFKDLEEVVSHHVRFDRLPFEVEIASAPVTSATSILKIRASWNWSALTWKKVTGERQVGLRLYGRVINLKGRIEQSFEAELIQPGNNEERLEFEVPVFPGKHQVAIAVQDVNADRLGSYFSDWVAVYPTGASCSTPRSPALHRR